MAWYAVTITETLERVVDIEADDRGQAVDLVEKMYDNEEVVLDAHDWIATEIGVAAELRWRDAE